MSPEGRTAKEVAAVRRLRRALADLSSEAPWSDREPTATAWPGRADEDDASAVRPDEPSCATP